MTTNSVSRHSQMSPRSKIHLPPSPPIKNYCSGRIPLIKCLVWDVPPQASVSPSVKWMAWPRRWITIGLPRTEFSPGPGIMMKSHQVPPADLGKKKKGHWHFSWTEMQSSRCSHGPSFCTPSHALSLHGQDSYWLPCLPRSVGEGKKHLSFLHPHENRRVTWILMNININLLVSSWLILIRFLVSEMASSPPRWPPSTGSIFLKDFVLVFLEGNLATQLC